MGLHDRLSRQGEGSTATIPSPNGHRPATAATDAPEVDPYAELKARIHHACIAKLGPELFRQEEGEDLGERVYRAVTEELTLDRTPLTREERRELVRQLTDDILGYGPLEPLLRDDSVTEIMVNAFDKIYVERSGRLERTDIRFVDDAHVMRIIDKIVSQIGRRVDEASPMVDARLPDGSRVNAIIPPLALERPDRHDSEVLARSVHDQRPDHLRHSHREVGSVPGRVRERQAQHPGVGRYGHRQDDDAERRCRHSFRPTSAS